MSRTDFYQLLRDKFVSQEIHNLRKGGVYSVSFPLHGELMIQVASNESLLTGYTITPLTLDDIDSKETVRILKEDSEKVVFMFYSSGKRLSLIITSIE